MQSPGITENQQNCQQARPRVLIVSPHLTLTLGGITAMVREIMQAEPAETFDFRQIASQADQYSKSGKIMLAVISFCRFLIQLLWWRPQMVFIHVGGNASMYRKAPFIIGSRLFGRRVLTHFHAGDFNYYFHHQSRPGQWLIMQSLGMSHCLIACSQELQQILRKYLPEARIVVVPNSVDTAIFTQEPNAADKLHGDESVSLLFVGAMGKLKGELDLLTALERVIPQVPQLRIMLLGHGSESVRELCEEMGIGSVIEQCGPVPMDERMDYFRRADMFVLPTYAEGMPVCVIEAMAAGLPIISTPVGGIPELITDGCEGWLVDPGNISALAEKITRLAMNKAERQSMGQAARSKAARFDRSVVMRRLTEVMRETAVVNNGTTRMSARHAEIALNPARKGD